MAQSTSVMQGQPSVGINVISQLLIVRQHFQDSERLIIYDSSEKFSTAFLFKWVLRTNFATFAHFLLFKMRFLFIFIGLWFLFDDLPIFTFLC